MRFKPHLPVTAAVVRLAFVALAATPIAAGAEQPTERDNQLRIFDGEPKIVIVNGYSTSFHWPKLLAAKLRKYSGGSSPIRIEKATAGGTPIARWIDLKSGKPARSWTTKLRPKLEEAGDTPTIVLCQQSLQWVWGERTAGIRNAEDEVRIEQGAAAIEKYADLMQEEGADLVFIAMHIYKHSMEPEIGNERLALAAYLRRSPSRVAAGPDVWQPTREVYPWGFAADRKHPGPAATAIMAQLWFETLLSHEGLDVPKWSRDEMRQAIEADRPGNRP